MALDGINLGKKHVRSSEKVYEAGASLLSKSADVEQKLRAERTNQSRTRKSLFGSLAVAAERTKRDLRAKSTVLKGPKCISSR